MHTEPNTNSLLLIVINVTKEILRGNFLYKHTPFLYSKDSIELCAEKEFKILQKKKKGRVEKSGLTPFGNRLMITMKVTTKCFLSI